MAFWRRRDVSGSAMLWFGEAVIALCGLLLPVLELLAPVHKKPRVRLLREQFRAMNRERKALLREVERDPAQAVEVVDEFMARHGDAESRASFEEAQASIRAIRQEGEELQRIAREAGEDVRLAADGFREYISTHGDSHLAYSYLGGALQRLGEWEDCITAYRDAIRLAGAGTMSGVSSRVTLGQALCAKGDVEAAIAELRSVIEEAPPEGECLIPLAYLVLGNALNTQGRRGDAHAAWKQAIRKDRTGIVARQARQMRKANP